MRTYRQYCSIARALDVVGDRWTLLIIREMLVRGPARYTDIRDGLPGIATNLLADRLRELMREGLICRRDLPPPVASTVFELTERGRELEPVLLALGRWGAPYMYDDPREDDQFRSRWLAWPAALLLTDSEPDAPPATVELSAGDEAVVFEVSGGRIEIRPSDGSEPDAWLRGTPGTLLGVLSGRLDLDTARSEGLEFRGDESVVRRMQPLAA